jgi:hypothetical protein
MIYGLRRWKEIIVNVKFIIWQRKNENRGRVDSVRALYSWRPGFKSRQGSWISWLRFFVVSFIPCRKVPVQDLKLHFGHFFPHHVKLIILSPAYHYVIPHNLSYSRRREISEDSTEAVYIYSHLLVRVKTEGRVVPPLHSASWCEWILRAKAC